MALARSRKPLSSDTTLTRTASSARRSSRRLWTRGVRRNSRRVTKAAGAALDQGIDKGVEAAGDWAVKKYGEKVVEFGMRNAPRAFSLGMKGAGRLVPIVGWALLAKDVLDVAAWGYGQYEYYRTKPW